ncbi:MAG: hypothetical protein AAFQ89_11880 [Cyanobacteria bacterium J06626_18]
MTKISPCLDGEQLKASNFGNGTHVGFLVISKQAVHDCYQVALAAGGISEGKPGPRPYYGEPYYGCFIRDLDGHKLEASFWDMTLGHE